MRPPRQHRPPAALERGPSPSLEIAVTTMIGDHPYSRKQRPRTCLLWCLGLALASCALPAAQGRATTSSMHHVSSQSAARNQTGPNLNSAVGQIMTSPLKTVPAGILLRLPATTEVLWSAPLPRTPQLFVAPFYNSWNWPTKLRPGRNVLTWQTAISTTGHVTLLKTTGVRLIARATPSRTSRTVALELRATVSAALSRYMDRALNGPAHPQLANNCSSSFPTRHDAFLIRRTHLPGSRLTALTLTATNGKGCYFVRFRRAGAYRISLQARSVIGSGPSLCVWSAPFGPCILTWAGHAARTWQIFRRVIAVPPDSYLYLYAPARMGSTTVQFDQINIWRVNLPPRAAYITDPNAASTR